MIYFTLETVIEMDILIEEIPTIHFAILEHKKEIRMAPLLNKINFVDFKSLVLLNVLSEREREFLNHRVSVNWTFFHGEKHFNATSKKKQPAIQNTIKL